MFYYLSLAAALFAIGFYGVFARKDYSGKLIALFIMLNSIIINLAAFDKFVQNGSYTGLVLIVFTLIIVLTELFIGAWIFYQWLLDKSSSEPDDSIEILK